MFEGWLNDFTKWFGENIETLIDWFLEGVVGGINLWIAAFAGAVDFCTSFLPTVTLPTFAQFDSTVVEAINFWIPMDILAALATAWLISEVAYLVAAPVLRWVKLVR